MNNKDIQSIIRSLQRVLEGDPWYGRSVYAILNEVHPAAVYQKPCASAHSLIDLLYHMITWSDFTLKRLEKNPEVGMEEELDWREIDPTIHTWENGVEEFRQINDAIIALLQTRDDALLGEKVDFREYNFHTLLTGLIQHHIYHLGQIAYVKKMIEGMK